jgi:hypothetical protein
MPNLNIVFILLSFADKYIAMLEEIKKNIKPYEKIENHRRQNGITYTFIANSINLSIGYLRKCLLGETALTENNRKKINELWGTDF